MADPAFGEVETEAENFPSRFNYRRNNKLRGEPAIETSPHEEDPLLGPPVLGNQIQKRWYNTPSVRLQFVKYFLSIRSCFGCCPDFC
jgi:hypothetical protein